MAEVDAATRLAEILDAKGDLGPLFASPVARSVSAIVADDTWFAKYSAYLDKCVRDGVRVVSFWDAQYPAALRAIKDPPPLLYVAGNRFPIDRPLAVVGTREISEQGTRLGQALVDDLVDRGFGIVSGLARGADTVALNTAVEKKGQAMAILPSSVHNVQPSQNRPLARQILANGSVVSEVTDILPVHKGRFIERNRIISGLSSAVLVLESRPGKGTSHQVKFAIEQGKPTFLLYQGYLSGLTATAGQTELMELGAVPIKSADQLVEDMRRHGVAVPS